RSALWGLLSMVPLTVTIAAIYGAIGIVGKEYDMPVAVLSSLTLGLAVDFAIHFLARSRAIYTETGSWKEAAPQVFGEPARAIMRNIIVIAAGFLPLLLAPLIPYKTVGTLLATILLVSGVATLFILPAMIRLLEKRMFATSADTSIACKCGTCIAASVAAGALVVVNGYRYLDIGLNWLVLVAVGVVLVAAGACRMLSKRDKCILNPAPVGKEN
ncbi:MAG: MMPL family transporter, partial [Phycisphaerae bacterium]